MAIDRPTFHEAWYRVAQMRPRLLTSVQVYRQFFRGKMWYVLENPTNNKYSRISSEAHHFIGLLDGKRTVDEVWHICNEQLGDMAPTQGELIQLLGQLYSSNLLYAELASDTESLFNRYQSRIKRQIQGFASNLLFVRIPLYDPEHFLNRWVSIFGKAFTPAGFLVWLGVILTGLYFVISNAGELVYQSKDVLAPENIFLLYLSMVFIKVLHEFGHAFACKKFGQYNGNDGRVHVMGVMFLVFVPLPYVDASSAWAFKRKRHRAIVGMTGVMVELFLAAVAAVVWANTSTGTLHIIAYNVIFIASVSTLIFNGNPLLRFDAYYVLSDVLEIPNLSQRSKNFIYYLVKRFVWGLKKLRTPAHTLGESIWFGFYGIASMVYRIFICVRILLFLNNRLPEELFILVPIFAAAAIITWVFVPVGKFIHYLFAGNELARDRGRAVSATLGTLALLVVLLGLIRFNDYCRIEGIVEPVDLSVVHMKTDGFVSGYMPSGQIVNTESDPLIIADNHKLRAEHKAMLAERNSLEIKRRIAETKEIAAAQMYAEQVAAMDQRVSRVAQEIQWLDLRSEFAGKWVSPEIERAKGMYLSRGERVGYVADLGQLRIRATAKQKTAAMLIEQSYDDVEIRVKGSPVQLVKGTREQIFPAGQQVLPSQALGYAVGGSMATQARDPQGIRSAEMFFEVRIRPHPSDTVKLLTGQRVIVRLRTKPKPLAVQWWHSLRQLFQRRFRV